MVAGIGILLGLERIDGGGTLLDEGSLPQLFTAFRVGLIYGLAAPLLLGVAEPDPPPAVDDRGHREQLFGERCPGRPLREHGVERRLHRKCRTPRRAAHQAS